jgi:hypothetical protein
LEAEAALEKAGEPRDIAHCQIDVIEIQHLKISIA